MINFTETDFYKLLFTLYENIENLLIEPVFVWENVYCHYSGPK